MSSSPLSLSRSKLLIGSGATLLAAGCGGGSRIFVPETQIVTPRGTGRGATAYTSKSADGNSMSLYDDSGKLLMRVSTDGLNITATDGTGKTWVHFARGDYASSVYSSQLGTASFDKSYPNTSGSHQVLNVNMNVISTYQGTYVPPKSSSRGTLTRVVSADGDSTSVYQPRFLNATKNSYNDYGWQRLVAGGTSGGSGCPPHGCPLAPSMSPHCLGVYVEFVTMTLALAALEMALAILETMTVGLASFVVAAVELMVFAYYVYLINQVEHCLQN